MNKLKQLPTVEDMFEKEYVAKGTAMREEFDEKSRVCTMQNSSNMLVLMQESLSNS